MSELSKDLEEILQEKNEKIVAGNIRAGVQIFDVVGGFTGGELDTTDATATPSDIVKDKTAYVNGEKITGELDLSDVDFNVKVKLENWIKGSSLDNIISSNLLKVDFSMTDLSAKTSMNSAFSNCYYLTDVKGLDVSSVTTAQTMFNGCSELLRVDIRNTGKITSMYLMFSSCRKLIEIPELDCSSCTSVYGTFGSCNELVHMGGMKNLGKAYTQTTAEYSNYRLNFAQSTKLDHDSLMNIINGLYDLNLTYDVANGGTLYKQALLLSSQSKSLLTADEIAIATNKGWIVS